MSPLLTPNSTILFSNPSLLLLSPSLLLLQLRLLSRFCLAVNLELQHCSAQKIKTCFRTIGCRTLFCRQIPVDYPPCSLRLLLFPTVVLAFPDRSIWDQANPRILLSSTNHIRNHSILLVASRDTTKHHLSRHRSVPLRHCDINWDAVADSGEASTHCLKIRNPEYRSLKRLWHSQARCGFGG